MPSLETVSLVFLGFALFAHLLSTGIATWRCRRRGAGGRCVDETPFSLVRPVCGVDQHDAQTLASSFAIAHPRYEVIFCCATARDAAFALSQKLVARFSGRDACVLTGDDHPTANPKLNNIVKGWNAAKYAWIVLADSNVLVTPDYFARLKNAWREDTGLVCSPPVASRPQGFFAEIECAFLNTYQARWQYAADGIGFGFAQGKTMLWRRDILEEAGGIRALGAEIAEDAAATKIVRARGLRVRLADRPFEQPLGYRTAQQVWNRQVRWARLRRATFAIYFLPEVLTGSVPPLLASIPAANALGAEPAVMLLLVFAIWYLAEAALAMSAEWHFSKWSPLAWLVRDLSLPFLWIAALSGNGFNWRGNAMSVATSDAPPALAQ